MTDEELEKFFDMIDQMVCEFPVLNKMFRCPYSPKIIKCAIPTKLYDIIIHLNDTHKFTREQIADYVDNITTMEV